MHVGGIFCDLLKAFDFVIHEICVTKLHSYRIQGTAAKRFRSYLTDRKQTVELKSQENNLHFFSNLLKTKHGIPKGTILGPFLFILYINDLPPTINTLTEPIIFVDDTSAIIPNKHFDDFFPT
jgi:hypothetical protein